MDARWVEEGRYHRVHFTGLRTLQAVTALLEQVRAKAEETGEYRWLFDMSKSDEGMNVADKFVLGTYLADHFAARYSISAVVPKAQITGFLENVSANRGMVRFRVTDSEAEARTFVAEPGR